MDADLLSADDRMLVEGLLRGFTPREQEIVHMRFTLGFTQAEIAERLGISQVQVSRLLRLTLKRMHEKLASDPTFEERRTHDGAQ